MLREKGDEIFEMSESSMWESALRTLKSLTNELETTHAQVESDEKLDKSKLIWIFQFKPTPVYSYNEGGALDPTCFRYQGRGGNQPRT